VSVTEVTVEVVSFHPTATTFRSPAVCAAGNLTVTDAESACGVAYATCTNFTAVVSCELGALPGSVFRGPPESPPQAAHDAAASALSPRRKDRALD
jgi:hypothetical protein